MRLRLKTWLFAALFSKVLWQCSAAISEEGFSQEHLSDIGNNLTSVFVTSSESASFLELENLIGSIHTHAPNYRIIVYDLGLTRTQLSILSTYWHVDIYQPPITYRPNETAQFHNRLKAFEFAAILTLHALSYHDRIIYLSPGKELVGHPSSIETILNRQGYFYQLAKDFETTDECYSNPIEFEDTSAFFTRSSMNDQFDIKRISCLFEIQAYDKNGGRQRSKYQRDNPIDSILKPIVACALDGNCTQKRNDSISAKILDQFGLSNMDHSVQTTGRRNVETGNDSAGFSRESSSRMKHLIINQRRNYCHKPYIDLIRKRMKLAIVIPFTSAQLPALITQLNLSTVLYPCCQKRKQNGSKQYSYPVDLLFYYNGRYNKGLIEYLKNYIATLDYVQKCFSRISFIFANLNETEDRYPFGINLMWQRLFLESQEMNLALRAHGYTHFFWMEPDTRPIRNYWLDAVLREITNYRVIRDDHRYVISNWWQRGSIYRGTQDIGEILLHINGNALYHLSSTFLCYLKQVWELFPFEKEVHAAFDTNLFFYLFGKPEEVALQRSWLGSKQERHEMAKHYWHKFVFADYIQNCAYTGCTNSPIVDSPLTFLVHGGFKRIQSRESSTLPCPLLYFCFVSFAVCIYAYLKSSSLRTMHLFMKLRIAVCRCFYNRSRWILDNDLHLRRHPSLELHEKNHRSF